MAGMMNMERLYKALKNEYKGKSNIKVVQEGIKILLESKGKHDERSSLWIFVDGSSVLNVEGIEQKFPDDLLLEAIQAFEKASARRE